MEIVTDVGALAGWFSPERPGPMLYEHLAATGVGSARVDRWPDPRAVLVELPGGNYALRGDPDALRPADLDDVTGFVEAPPEWLPFLRRVDAGTGSWPRVVSALPAETTLPAPGPRVRRLGRAAAPALASLGPVEVWIHETWGGAQALAAAGVSTGVFEGPRLVSVAVPFYVGAHHEDIGVVTEAGHRGRGLSTACAAALAADVRGRGRVPTWTTSPDNTASLGVAARLGFTHRRDDVLYAVRTPVPG